MYNRHVQPTSPTNFSKHPSQLIPQPTSSIYISDQTSHLEVTPIEPRFGSRFFIVFGEAGDNNLKEYKENQTTYTLPKKNEKEAGDKSHYERLEM
jgi:hypothetical protein